METMPFPSDRSTAVPQDATTSPQTEPSTHSKRCQKFFFWMVKNQFLFVFLQPQ